MTCIDTKTKCTKCLNNKFADASNNCVANCPLGFYNDAVKLTCEACDPLCT